MLTKNKSTQLLLVFLAILGIVDLAVLLGVPVLAQYAGFTFYSIAPGVLLLYLFGLDRLSLTEKAPLSIGLSFAVLTFFGLLFNWLLPLLGISRPLETGPVIVSFSVVLIVLAAITYLRRKGSFFSLRSEFSLTTREKIWLLLPVSLPLLSIFGTYVMNTTDNNSLLLAGIALMMVYLVVVAINHRRVSEKVYPVALCCFSAAFMALFILRFPHTVGADVHAEYYLFMQTVKAGQWQIHPNELLDADTVISLLPAIYYSFVKMNPEYFYSLIPRMVYVVLPLVVYSISRRYVSSFYAFLSAVFFISQLTFLDDGGDFRNRVAVFFFALVIMVLVHQNLTEINRRFLFIVFSAMCVVSNYSTTYVFLILLALAWAGVRVYSRIKQNKVRRVVSNSTAHPVASEGSYTLGNARNMAPIETGIRISMVMLLGAFIFVWYGQIAGTAFHLGVKFIVATITNMGRFSSPQVRTSLITAATGGTLRPFEIPQYVELYISWITIAFAAIGILVVVGRRIFNVRLPGKGISDLSDRFDSGFLMLSISGCVIGVLTVVLPYVSKGYDLARTYFQMMVILAPFFVIGGEALAALLRVRLPYYLAMVVLVIYLSVTSGLLYEVFGKPHVLALSSKEGVPYQLFYVHDQDSYAAKWLRQYSTSATIYSYGNGSWLLLSQGSFARGEVGPDMTHVIGAGGLPSGYVYLTYSFVALDKVWLPGGRLVGAAPYREKLASGDIIYASNGAMIYRMNPE